MIKEVLRNILYTANDGFPVQRHRKSPENTQPVRKRLSAWQLKATGSGCWKEKEIEGSCRYFHEERNNPILIGESGVGKTAIVEGLVRYIATKEVPANLQNKRIFTLISLYYCRVKIQGRFEERLRRCLPK